MDVSQFTSSSRNETSFQHIAKIRQIGVGDTPTETQQTLEMEMIKFWHIFRFDSQPNFSEKRTFRVLA